MTDSLAIAEFEARASECVRRARAGERIVVTDGGRPVALLTAVGDPKRKLSFIERLEQGVEEGWVRPPKHRGPLRSYTPPPLPPGPTIAELLAEDRAE